MRRQAFTLVEMLVSLALVLFIMVLLSQALSTGLETFRQLKSTGEMEGKLRMAGQILRQDLKLDHFEGKRRLSDPSFWTQGPPREGFFHIEQGSPSTVEGVDGDGIPSYYAINHRLHFSIKLRGSQRDDFLSANVPVGPPLSPLLSSTTTYFDFPPDARFQDPAIPNVQWAPYNSQWAEAAYFLWPNGSQAGGTPLYSLYRRQRLAVPNNQYLNWGTPTQGIRINNANDLKALPLKLWQYSGISCQKNKPDNSIPDFLYFNNPTDLTVPERRFGMLPQPQSYGMASNYQPLQDLANLALSPADYQRGSDLLLTDVLSFTVRVLSQDIDPYNFTDLKPLTGLNPLGIPWPPVRIFDTWSSVQDELYTYYGTSAPMPIRINALQITLRVYDLKTQQTRQVTIIQDM